LRNPRKFVECAAVEESWDQIGSRLRNARDKAELTVDDVVFRTRIPRSIVEALEAEDFSVFTSPTYAKSFLRQYSEFLSVDADPWLDALEPASYVSGESWQPMFAAGESPASLKREGREPEAATSGPNKWSALWVMLLTAALVVAITKGYQVFDKKFGGDDAPKTVETPKQGTLEKKIHLPIPPAKVEESIPPEQAKKQEEASGAPRAIIVRD
jgi:cytoskeletal protein RodZ